MQSLDRAAQELGIRPMTVLSHLWKAAKVGIPLPQSAIRAHKEFSPAVEADAFAYFDEGAGLVALRPLYDRFEGTVSYDDLRILELCHYLTRHPPCSTT